jgi:argininosuccinate lyase
MRLSDWVAMTAEIDSNADEEMEVPRNDYSLQFRRILDKPALEQRLLLCALATTYAHVEMLSHTGLVAQESGVEILEALAVLKAEARAGRSVLTPGDADVYDAIVLVDSAVALLFLSLP